MRKTVDRVAIVAVANKMIAHLAESGTHDDQIKREAIIAVTSYILLDGNAYAGYRYLNPPVPETRFTGYTGMRYDETRVAFY